MRKLYVATVAGIAVLFAIAYWKNSLSYRLKSIKWRLGKSTVDCSLIVLAAFYMPALLAGWLVMWLTRGIKRPGIQLTLSFIFGVIFSSIGGVALEILCVLSVLAIDLLTGARGIYGWYKQPIPASFLPKFAEGEHAQVNL